MRLLIATSMGMRWQVWSSLLSSLAVISNLLSWTDHLQAVVSRQTVVVWFAALYLFLAGNVWDTRTLRSPLAGHMQ